MFGLGSKIVAWIAGGLAAALLAALVYTTLTKNAVISELRNANTALQGKLDFCNRDRLTLKANQGTLEATIGRQNSSIEAARAEALRRSAEAAEARVRASEAARRAATAAERLANAAPRAGVDNCQAADELILEMLQ